jgi:hypothetical protein
MGHYPAWPGSQSYLRIACIFNHSTGGSGDFVSSTFTIHDFENAVYHNGAARNMSNPAVVALGSLTIPVADCTSALAWVNRTISGPGIAARTFVKSITGPCTPTGTLNLNLATTAAIPANSTLQVENSSVRSTNTATVQAVTPMVCDPNANFLAGDTNLSIDGTDFAPGTVISVNPSAPGCVDTNPPPTPVATPPIDTAQVITIGGTLDGGSPGAIAPSTTRQIDDASSVALNTITSPAARFLVSDIGLRVSGTGITQPCYIASRTGGVATLSSNCSTISAGPNLVTIGDPSKTAPATTDTVLNQGVQLPLSPTLVPGSQPCSADNSSGFGIEGTWRNPGNFVPNSGFAVQPPNSKAIGQILFSTSVISYAAFVVEEPALNDPANASYHFNIEFPNVPTGLALCPSTPTSPGLGFSIGINGTAVSQAALATGVGRPATAQLRSTRASTTGSTSTGILTDDINGTGVKWTSVADFQRLCSVPAGTPNINFTCGDG